MVVARKEGATDSLYLNGGLLLTETGKVSAIGGCLDRATLGRGWTGGFTGMIAEVLVYLRALSDIERQAVEKYLMNKYKISEK